VTGVIAGHVESGQVLVSFTRTPGEVVNGVSTLENRCYDPTQARHGNCAAFQCAAGHEAAANRGKENRIKKRGVLAIEWAVDKDRLRRV
jgi:hypothetical protein